MQEPSRRRLWNLSNLFSLGKVPGSPEEAEAFLRRRVMLFVGGSFALWASAFVLNILIVALTMPETLAARMARPAMFAHAGGCLALGALFAFLRHRERAPPVLNVVDAVCTLTQPFLLAWLTTQFRVHLRPELAMALASTHVLVVRATLVPSAAFRTAVLGALGFVPLAIVTYRMHEGHPLAPDDPPASAYAVAVFFWALVAIAVTGFISRVLFGLQAEVQKARRLGQYTLGEQIGRGGMGVVYLAQHALLRRPTAVKLLPPERAGATALARFEREVQITSRLTHPNTIAIYDYGHTPDGLFYYAMEYLEGLDLERLVGAEGPLPPGRVAHFLRQVAGSLAEAHRSGLIHRDVKPSNLILCERGFVPDFVKVLDFGLVRDTRSGDPALTQEKALAGSPLYMSPEQIVSPEAVDGRSDLYSLGAVGYQLLTGTPPFQGTSVAAVCGQHIHSPPQRPSERLTVAVPPKLEALVLRCLEKDPAQRPADADAFVTQLEACDDVEPWERAAAERWWRERGTELRRRPLDPNLPSGGRRTIDVGASLGGS